MTLAEALAQVEAGNRVTCDYLQPGCVVKRVADWRRGQVVRVVNSVLGYAYDFTARPEHECQQWRTVTGWEI